MSMHLRLCSFFFLPTSLCFLFLLPAVNTALSFSVLVSHGSICTHLFLDRSPLSSSSIASQEGTKEGGFSDFLSLLIMAKPGLRKKSPHPARRSNLTTAAASQTGEAPLSPSASSSSSRPGDQGEEAAGSSQCSSSAGSSSATASPPLDSCSRRSSSDCSSTAEETSQDGEVAFDNLLKDLREDLGLDKNALQDIKLRLASAYIRDIHELWSAVRQRRLCGLLHPYITEALCARLTGEPLPLFDLGEYSEARMKIRNPAKFHHGAIFVHRVAPVPGTRKGKIAVTWAFDMDLEETTVAELLQRLETLIRDIPVDRMRLVFNGFTLAATSSLASYDITEGDTLYLYTLRDPRAQTAYVCATGPSPPAIVTPPPPPGGCVLPDEKHPDRATMNVGVPASTTSHSTSSSPSPPFQTVISKPPHVITTSPSSPPASSSPPAVGVCTPGGFVAAAPAVMQAHHVSSGGTVVASQPGGGGIGQCQTTTSTPAIIQQTMGPHHQHATHTTVTPMSSSWGEGPVAVASHSPYGTLVGLGCPARPPHPGDPPVYMSFASAPHGIHMVSQAPPSMAAAPHCSCSGSAGGGCYTNPASLNFTPTTTIVSPHTNPQTITQLIHRAPPSVSPSCPHMMIGGASSALGGHGAGEVGVGNGGGGSNVTWIGPKATRETCRVAQPYVRTMEVCSCGACAGFQYAPLRSTLSPAPCTVPVGAGTCTYMSGERREKRRDSSDQSVSTDG
ncbi:ubiquitin family protein [Cystoisospora suis]|uniref:Ubiquitin family protein n=1 Tax=Cystoisospora suis TaxID=483139 RepID=A0A2C6KYX5_9APIC|nr:ubiquitin family protein [Cystoisospora suis]